MSLAGQATSPRQQRNMATRRRCCSIPLRLTRSKERTCRNHTALSDSLLATNTVPLPASLSVCLSVRVSPYVGQCSCVLCAAQRIGLSITGGCASAFAIRCHGNYASSPAADADRQLFVYSANLRHHFAAKNYPTTDSLF